MYTRELQIPHAPAAETGSAASAPTTEPAPTSPRERISTRVLATRALAEEMGAQAERYLRLTHRLDVTIRSAKLRQRTAWLHASRPRG